jgi:hypothetical protein
LTGIVDGLDFSVSQGIFCGFPTVAADTDHFSPTHDDAAHRDFAIPGSFRSQS